MIWSLMKRKSKKRTKVYKGRFRSMFEKRIADTLTERGIEYDYEKERYVWYVKSRNGLLCPNCGEVAGMVKRYYTPDFFIRQTGVVIEAKGRLTTQDRTKLTSVKLKHPELDLRLLFQDDGFLTTSRNRVDQRRIRNSEWAESNGFIFAICGRGGNNIPEEWLRK